MHAQHKEYVFHFLMGLNDRFGTLIGKILLIERFPSLSKVCSLILQEEKRKSIGNCQCGSAIGPCCYVCEWY